MTGNVAFILTYAVTIGAAILVLSLDGFGRRKMGVAVGGSVLAMSACAGLAAGVMHTAGTHVGTIEVGGPASMVYGVIALVGAASVFAGVSRLATRPAGASIAALICLGVACAGAAAAATDLITLFLLLEALALVSYALVASEGNARSGEAAMKYFVQGALATALFVFGMAIFVGLYAPSGQYAILTDALVSPRPLVTAVAATGLVLAFLAFKMGAFPFHSWAPDAYETAPVEAAAFMAAGVKLAAIAAAGIFVSIVSAGRIGPRVLMVTAALAVLSIVIGSAAALWQADYRRLLAYAGIAQAGYALIAIAMATAPLAVFFGATYALATAGAFLAALEFTRVRPEWDGSVAGLAGLGREAPLVSSCVAVLLISLAGVPPFLGFWAKLLVFGTGLSLAVQTWSTSPYVAACIAVAVAVGVIGSVVSLGFYGYIIKALYFDRGEGGGLQSEDGVRPTVGSAGISVALLAAAVVILGVLPLVFGSTVLFDLFAAR